MLFEKTLDYLRKKMPLLCFACFGQGVVQAWISLSLNLAGATDAFGQPQALTIIDYGSLVPYALFFLAAGRIAPVINRKLPLLLGMGAMVAAAGLVALSLAGGLPHSVLVAGLALAGAGSAVAFLYWWELYSVLNPLEVAFYYAGSCLIKDVVVFLLAGYCEAYLIGALLVLPFASLVLYDRGKTVLERSGRQPAVAHGAASFPWKPMLFLGLYGFAFGYGAQMVSLANIPLLRFAATIPAVIVLCSIVFDRGWFNFAFVYQFILPTAIVGLLALLVFPGIHPAAALVGVRASYVAVYIYIAIMLENLARRYKMSAVWLFSMMGLVHTASISLGRAAFMLVASPLVPIIFVICVVLTTFLLVTEPKLSSDWGISLTGKNTELGRRAKTELALQSLALRYGLTVREQEIALAMAEGKMPRAIGKELHIAPGTVKAHMQHIYRKVGVHSKEELLELVKGQSGTTQRP